MGAQVRRTIAGLVGLGLGIFIAASSGSIGSAIDIMNIILWPIAMMMAWR